MRNPFRNNFEAWREWTEEAYRYERYAEESNSDFKKYGVKSCEKWRNYWLCLAEQNRYFAAQAIGFKSFEKLDKYLKKYGGLTIKGCTICSGERA